MFLSAFIEGGLVFSHLEKGWVGVFVPARKGWVGLFSSYFSPARPITLLRPITSLRPIKYASKHTTLDIYRTPIVPFNREFYRTVSENLHRPPYRTWSLKDVAANLPPIIIGRICSVCFSPSKGYDTNAALPKTKYILFLICI